MKVVCIEPFKGRQQRGITFGISYDVVNPITFGGGIIIINDVGKQRTYKKSRFINLKKWRERQLNEIGL